MKYAIVAIILSFCGYAFAGYLTMPDVYMSYSTKKCVKIVDYQGNDHACGEMPTKYNLVWTK